MALQGREEEYTYHFTDSDIGELAAAVSKTKAAGVSSEHDILKVEHTLLCDLMHSPHNHCLTLPDTVLLCFTLSYTVLHCLTLSDTVHICCHSAHAMQFSRLHSDACSLQT